MRRLIFPILLGVLGCAVLIALGMWQVQRLHWKQAILSDIDARITAAPVALPASPDPQADRYLPVTVDGTYLGGEARVLTGLKGVGAGYRVIAPFETAEGRRILIDRGFVREADRDTPRPTGPARITGNLHWPDETDGFTPDPDVAAGLWFARDVARMAAHFGTDPVLVVLRESDGAPGVSPMPVTTSGIPNDHLGYAVTWFGLAVVWAGMTLLLIRRMARGGREGRT